jgi:transcriptional regulator with XRE-family HTH domain
MGRRPRSGTKEMWRRWGYDLQKYRLMAGLTQEQLARQMGISPPTVSSFETGHRPPRREYAGHADKILKTDGALENLWIECNAEGAIPESWRDFARLERQATEIREYQPLIIPGLLQTPSFIAAIMRNTRAWDSDEQIENLVNARTARMENLRHAVLTFIVKETTLGEVVGCPAVQIEQLDYILTLLEQRRIRLVVIPRFAPGSPFAAGSFRIMSLTDGRRVVHAEHEGGLSVISGRREVDNITRLFGDLQAEALSRRSSIELIRKTKSELS